MTGPIQQGTKSDPLSLQYAEGPGPLGGSHVVCGKVTSLSWFVEW